MVYKKANCRPYVGYAFLCSIYYGNLRHLLLEAIMEHNLGYLTTEYARNKMIESYDIEAKNRERNKNNDSISFDGCTKVQFSFDETLDLSQKAR